LYTYCIYELRMSEDAAARRSSAARLVKAFPPLLDAIAAGELHLTGLLMLGPHLTPDNHVRVLARAKFRTKKELAKLVRELHPLPHTPDQMEALGPEPLHRPSEPTWQEWITSLGPPVRELPSSERPGEWAEDCVPSSGDEHASAAADDGEPADHRSTNPDDDASTAPARCELPPITAPQQYRMQFTTSEEHVRLVERAKALLARTAPGCSLGELHQRAMQLLVAQLEKAKFAVTERSQTAEPQRAPTESGLTSQARELRVDPKTPIEVTNETLADQGATTMRRQPPRGGATLGCEAEPPANDGSVSPSAFRPAQQNRAPRWRCRHVPAAVKREVFLRDTGRCNYVDERGERCRETRYLELHHLQPFARGGQHVATNLALRCAAHNALAAEEDFGTASIEHQRHLARHDSFAAEARPWPLSRA
jgi:hypothetical protein